MDCISLDVQQRQLRDVFSRALQPLHSLQLRRQPQTQPVDSTKQALQFLIAANAPLFVGYYASLAKAALVAEKDFETTFASRWIGHYIPASRRHLLTSFARSRYDEVALDYSLQWALTHETIKSGRWWTWLTAAFLHISPDHLLANMTALYGLGSICNKLPGMTVAHIFCVALGSALSSSLACTFDITSSSRLPLGGRYIAFGASGMVSGFSAVALLACPKERMQMSFGVFQISATTWMLTGLSLVSDLLGWCKTRWPSIFPSGWTGGPQKMPMFANPQQTVGYAAHLGGAAFGALYYLLILRPAAARADQEMMNEIYRGRIVRRPRDL